VEGWLEIGFSNHPQGQLSFLKKLSKDSLGAQELSGPFLGLTGKMEGTQRVQHPSPDPEKKISLTFSAPGKFPVRAKIPEQRQEKESQVKFVGRGGFGKAQAVERRSETQEFFPFPSLLQGGKERRKKGKEHSRFDHQPHRFFGRAFPEFSEKFIPDPGRGAEPDSFYMGEQGLVRFPFDDEAGTGSVPDDPEHADGVMDKFFLRVPDAADYPPP